MSKTCVSHVTPPTLQVRDLAEVPIILPAVAEVTKRTGSIHNHVYIHVLPV